MDEDPTADALTVDDLTVDDLSYDDLRYDEPAGALAGQVLPALAALLILVLGAPAVWDVLSAGRFGPAVVFYPVLLVALGHLALRGRRP